MKTKTITLYEFDELSNDAKERARDWYREGVLEYDWWDATYEDAERAGLKLTEFDCDRNTVRGTLTTDVLDSCNRILKDHGKACDTYSLALLYHEKCLRLRATEENSEEDYTEEWDELRDHYTQALCEEYLSLLKQEVEYLLSDESVDETIRANEYTFTETGTREN